MSGKQDNNNRATEEGVFTNPAFPNKLFKKVNGKDIVVSVRARVVNKETNATSKTNIKTKAK